MEAHSALCQPSALFSNDGIVHIIRIIHDEYGYEFPKDDEYKYEKSVTNVAVFQIIINW